MARWQQWPVIDSAYADDARPWSAQDTCNWLPAPAEQAGTRSAIMLRTPPGLVEFCDLGTDAPLRGSHNVEGLLLVVSDNTLFRISTAGVATAIGTIPGVGRVSMDHTPRGAGFHVGIANGQSGYIYDTATDTLTQITDPGFPGATIFQFIDGYLAFLEPFGKFWGHSELNDGLSYNTLDRYTAESAPDGIVSLIVSHREVFVLGTRSGEFFRNTGAATGTFQRADGYEMERGICSPCAIARSDNTVKWVGDDGATYRLEGHQPVRVSNGPIEQAFSRSNLANAFAFAWEDKSHNVFYVTLPDGQTWGHDAWTQRWHRRQSYGLNRWRLATLTKWNNQWIGGDYSNGKLYTLSWADDAVHENGEPLISERTFPVAHDVGNDLIINGIRLLFDTGKRSISRPVIVGDVPDGTEGDVISGAYTVSGGLAPYSAIVVQSGTFPPGLTLNPDGTYSGTYTTAGSYSWTVGGTDALGQPFSTPDTAIVLALIGEWWLTTSGSIPEDNDLYISADPLVFGAGTTRTPNITPSYGPKTAGTDAVLVAERGGSATLERITDLVPPIDTALVSVAGNIGHIRHVAGITFLIPLLGLDYYYSEDGGANWQTGTVPAAPGLFVADIAKLGDRWLTLASGIGGGFYYSDEVGPPTTWEFGSPSNAGGGGHAEQYIATSATSAVSFSTTDCKRTTDGETWTSVPGSPGDADARDGLSINGVYICHLGATGSIQRSADDGLTWGEVFFTGAPTVDTCNRLEIGNGYVVASMTGDGPYISADDGLTWTRCNNHGGGRNMAFVTRSEAV